MRLFIAIDLPVEIKDRIKELVESLEETGADLNISNVDNIHITLKFLGEVREGDVTSVVKIISDITSSYDSFKTHIKGMGYFGNPKFMKVIWLGLAEGTDETINIITELNKGLEHIRQDDHKPSPHITLARVSSNIGREDLLSEIEKMKDVEVGEFSVNKIKLVKSVLRAGGPIYSDVETFTLGTGGSV
ncbi:MAG: RNA 2',3'-cyclic phosphodiesterase [Candidatus Aenigmatarchaeota archaeon]